MLPELMGVGGRDGVNTATTASLAQALAGISRRNLRGQQQLLKVVAAEGPGSGSQPHERGPHSGVKTSPRLTANVGITALLTFKLAPRTS